MSAVSHPVRRWERGDLPASQRLALSAVFVALGTVLSVVSIPAGPAKVFPFQHMINVLSGVLLGPWYAVLTALGISLLRNALGTGTFLAFPGSMIGALLVGLGYHYVRRTDLMALLEPVGTVLIGGFGGYLLIAPLTAPVQLLGFIAARPSAPYLGLTGALAVIVSFGVSSIPGSLLGLVMLRALRRAGVGLAPARRGSPNAQPDRA